MLEENWNEWDNQDNRDSWNDSAHGNHPVSALYYLPAPH